MSKETWGMTAGMIRGEKIHVNCASKEDATVTWAAFWRPHEAPDEPCARCGKSLRLP